MTIPFDRKKIQKPVKKRAKAGSLPDDAPLLSFEDAACLLRMSTPAIRTIIHGRTDGYDDKLGSLLRGWVVTLSSHRRYIKRAPFMKWLRGLAGEDAA